MVFDEISMKAHAGGKIQRAINSLVWVVAHDLISEGNILCRAHGPLALEVGLSWWIDDRECDSTFFF